MTTPNIYPYLVQAGPGAEINLRLSDVIIREVPYEMLGRLAVDATRLYKQETELRNK
ncbi:MAG: hypothetical protein V7745_07630 [Pseudomonadales bacterium]